MSVWNDIRKRGLGEQVKQEDIHKCTAVVEKIGGAQRFRGFYDLYNKHICLNEEQKQSLRWHYFKICLKDERFNRWRYYKVGVISPLGNSGEEIVKDAVKTIEKKYGYFDGYTCDEVNTEMHKYVTKKNKDMIQEIRERLNLHNLKIVEWKRRVVYLKAISAELEQEVYYNSDDKNAHYVEEDENASPQLLTSGKYKEKSIGLYNVTFERTYKTEEGNTVLKNCKDYYFFAYKESDVVAAWQGLNDEFVKQNGEWIYYYDPKDKIERVEPQRSAYRDILKAYKKKLFEEHGCKIECG